MTYAVALILLVQVVLNAKDKNWQAFFGWLSALMFYSANLLTTIT